MNKFGLGQSVRRKEDYRFLTGTGRYTDDIDLPDQAHLHVLRSPHAHAAIRSIDTREASQAPGVVCVLTGADAEADGLGTLPCLVPLTNRDGSDIVRPPRHALARERVRHVGDPVAAVVAETLDQARDAAELIAVDYQPLPAIADTARAPESGSPQVWEQAARNICIDWEAGDRQATDAAFERADHVVSIDLVNNRLVAAPMEPRVAIGNYDAERDTYTLYLASQGSHRYKNPLSQHILKVPPEKIRVVTPDVGGGFGMKGFVYPEPVVALWAAKRVGRPVKWVSDRSQAFISDDQGRDHVTHAELALDSAGTFLAVRSETIANLGAYLSNAAPFIATAAAKGLQAGGYAVPAAYTSVKGVFTHTVPVDAYRGAGRPEAIFVIERLVDMAAQRLGIEPDEIRRRNVISADAMPYTTATDLTYDSGDFALNISKALEAAGWAEFPQRRDEARRRGKLRGIGMTYYVEFCAPPMLGGEDAIISFEEDDSITLLVGTQAGGQGHETVYAQLISYGLGLPFERINVHQGDTEEIAIGGGTAGSRSMMVQGNAISVAVDDVIAKARPIASDLLEVAADDLEFTDGRFTVAGTDRSAGLFEIAAAAREGKSGDGPLEGAGNFVPGSATYPNGCHVSEVEIDPETGALELVAYTVVDDFGRVVNPLLLAGQVHGGVAQGVGQALLENTIYEPESGQLLTGSFMDYGMPRAHDLPMMDCAWTEIPCRTNPLGIKGAGEAGSVAAPSTVINAVVNALAEFGVTHIDMPATPERIWRAIQGGASA